MGKFGILFFCGWRHTWDGFRGNFVSSYMTLGHNR